jgi:hypothetical protein
MILIKFAIYQFGNVFCHFVILSIWHYGSSVNSICQFVNSEMIKIIYVLEIILNFLFLMENYKKKKKIPERCSSYIS